MEAGIEKLEPKESGRRTYRAALAAVIFLSGLMGLAVIALALGFARQYRLYQADQPVGAAGAAAGIQLAPGAHIVSTTTEGGKLILHVQTPAGSEVDIIDLATGKLTGVVKDGAK